MTNEEFYNLYKGRRVRVNTNALDSKNIDREGIVIELRSYSYDGIKLDMDDKGYTCVFAANKLDVIDEKRVKVNPLPLPG